MSGNAPRRPANHGWLWVVEGLKTVRRCPGVFLSMGLIVAVIQMIPMLGGLVLLVTGPALVAGTIVAAQAATRGTRPAVGQLFAMFDAAPRRTEALKLCVPLLVGKGLALLVLAMAVARRLAASGVEMQELEGHPEKILALFGQGDMLPWLLAAIVLVLLAWTFTALAIPRVALGSERAFDAMRHGVRQVWASLGAWVVVLLLLFSALMAVTTVLMLTQWMLVVQIGLYTALYAVLGPILHAAWRDIGGAGPAPPPPPTPGPRPTPPPPSGVLEA